MKRVTFCAVVLLLLLWLLMTYVNKAQAVTILGNPQACYGLAVSSTEAVMYRDGGETWEENKPHLEAALGVYKGHPKSFVKDDDDVVLVLELFQQLWKQNDSAEVTAETVYALCMGFETENT